MAKTERAHWLTIITLFCAGLVGSMQFAKLSPIMPQVATEFSASSLMAGLFVSILGLVGVVLAITVVAVASAFGLARSLRWALIAGAGIAVLGAHAPEANSFLLSRFLEGLSHLFIVVCAPALMAEAATPKDRPIALALWGCFFGAGYAITSVAAPLIVESFGWRALLTAHGFAMLAVAAAVSVVTWSIKDKTQALSLGAIGRKHVEVFTSGAPLLLALTFFTYTIQFLAVLTFLIVLLTGTLKWPMAQVGILLAIAPLWSLLFTLSSGLLVRTGLGLAAGFVTTFATLAAATILVFAFTPSTPLLIAGLAVMMACFGLLPGLAFANMPRIAPTADRAILAYSGFALFGNLGTFLGTPLLAQVNADAGWIGVAVTLTLICILGSALAIVLDRRVLRHEQEVT
jgi:MFS transporter, DHA1 family, inner membrane transport protein